MMAGLLEMAGAKVEEEELVEACNEVMAAIDADGDGEVFSHQHLDLLFFLVLHLVNNCSIQRIKIPANYLSELMMIMKRSKRKKMYNLVHKKHLSNPLYSN